ncbi:hypothetical protein COO60DRAFT_1519093 [Scenedesmus sp. NREL 46B-D3]|nr:hypothetical protein COO60DRAFT_1519093 [Scenedesmus sp. NREL 46B-D3]
MTCLSISACRRLSATATAVLGPNAAKDLYRDLVRKIKQLPAGGTQQYYKNYTRQVFYNFTEERDPETLSRLHTKARQDAEWVLNKYSK